MPIEIRELVIRAAVDQDDRRVHATREAGSGQNLTEADINVIAEKVLEIIKEKSER